MFQGIKATEEHNMYVIYIALLVLRLINFTLRMALGLKEARQLRAQAQ